MALLVAGLLPTVAAARAADMSALHIGSTSRAMADGLGPSVACDGAGAAGTGGCRSTGSHGPGPDRVGLRKDTTYLLSYHVAAIGILYALPESVSGWGEEEKEKYTLSKWWHNVSNPRWDDDKFWINYITHPYWGASYYVRARERGYDERSSFWYSVVMSTAYEFGAEALFEQPSIQDLVVTPVGGVILGEYFMGLRARIGARYAPGEEMRFIDRALLAVTDPLGAINRRVQSWFGADVESSFYPYFGPQRLGVPAAYAADHVATEWVYGLRVNYRW